MPALFARSFHSPLILCFLRVDGIFALCGDAVDEAAVRLSDTHLGVIRQAELDKLHRFFADLRVEQGGCDLDAS